MTKIIKNISIKKMNIKDSIKDMSIKDIPSRDLDISIQTGVQPIDHNPSKVELAAHGFNSSWKQMDLHSGGEYINQNLFNTIYAGKNLSNINLTGSNLIASSFVETNLSGAILNKTKMRGAALSRANLTGAIVNEADLSDTNFTYADLSGAIFSGTCFDRANLKGVKVIGTKFIKTTFIGTDLSEVDLSRAEFIDVDLLQAKISDKKVSVIIQNAVQAERYTKVDFPTKCSIDEKIELSMQLKLKRPMEKLIRELFKIPFPNLKTEVILTLVVTACDFWLNNRRIMITAPIDADSEIAHFQMKPLVLGKLFAEVEIFYNAMRIGYFGVETQVYKDKNYIYQK